MKKKAKIIIGAIAGAVAVALIGTAVGFRIAAGGPYKGTVTDIDSGAPLANVSVTDGRNVVKTDEEGKFTLRGYYKTRFITVTTPAGYTTEKYYIPADRKTETYDFKLEKSEATAAVEHSFLQVSDTEIGEGGVGDWINHVKRTIDETNPAFLVQTGDICYEAGLKRHYSDMNKENMGVPVRYIMGNHDYVKGKYGEELFESIYGPAWFSMDVGNIHYVFTPFGWGADNMSGYGVNDHWIWLKNDLENVDPDMKVIIFNHNREPKELKVQAGVKKLDLKENNVIAWVYGHYHYNYVKNIDGFLSICTGQPGGGGIDSSPCGTREIHLDAENNLTTKMHYNDFRGNLPAPEGSEWSTQLDGNVMFTDTLAANGKIYTATSNDDYPAVFGVYCLDEKTGEVIWEFKTPNEVRNNLLYKDGKIIAQDCDGRVYSLNAETGEKVWEAKAEFNYSVGTTTGICADDAAVYAGNSCDVTAFSLADGKTLWTYNRNSGENSPAEFILVGNKLIIAPNWNCVAALDKATGKLLWESKAEGINYRNSTPIALDEKTILVADSGYVVTLNAETGETISQTAPEGYNFSVSAQPVVNGKIAYFSTFNKGVVAFNLETKEIVWECATGPAMVGTSQYTGGGSPTVEPTPVLKDGVLIFGASDGKLYRVNAADGKIISEFNIGAPIFGKAAVLADGSIVVGDFGGRVTKIPAPAAE